MLKIKDKSECTGCSACMLACPKNCIEMQPDDEGFLYPNIDLNKCINCLQCEKVCPVLVSEKITNKNIPKSFAVINGDDAVRNESSSGGMFTLIAEYVISQGGIVFGAAFSTDCYTVCHIGIDSVEELYKLRGSKYLQSNMGDCYNYVKQYLEQEKIVLFSGTPCQISGLKKYLGKKYDNLLLQDIVCHGVPSPVVWSKYLTEFEKNKGFKVKKVSFRNKNSGWKQYSLLLEFENNRTHSEIYSTNLYLRGFIKNLYLRPSCYNCVFKGVSREADITLADFWGVEKILPEIDDDKGISLVLLHNQKGQDLLKQCSSHSLIKEVDLSDVLKYNASVIDSAKRPECREEFMKLMRTESIIKLLKKYCGISLTQKIVRKIRSSLF